MQARHHDTTLTHSEHGLRCPRSGEVSVSCCVCLGERRAFHIEDGGVQEQEEVPHGEGDTVGWCLLGHCSQCWLSPAPGLRGVAGNSVPSWRRCSVLNTSAFHHLSGLGGPRVSLAEHRSVQTLWHGPSTLCRHPENPQMALLDSGQRAAMMPKTPWAMMGVYALSANVSIWNLGLILNWIMTKLSPASFSNGHSMTTVVKWNVLCLSGELSDFPDQPFCTPSRQSYQQAYFQSCLLDSFQLGDGKRKIFLKCPEQESKHEVWPPGSPQQMLRDLQAQ